MIKLCFLCGWRIPLHLRGTEASEHRLMVWHMAACHLPRYSALGGPDFAHCWCGITLAYTSDLVLWSMLESHWGHDIEGHFLKASLSDGPA